MTTMTVRMPDEDARLAKRCAAVEGVSFSDFACAAIMGHVENQHDVEALKVAMDEDGGTRFSHEEVMRELAR